jgi:hypothetical protein
MRESQWPWPSLYFPIDHLRQAIFHRSVPIAGVCAVCTALIDGQVSLKVPLSPEIKLSADVILNWVEISFMTIALRTMLFRQAI